VVSEAEKSFQSLAADIEVEDLRTQVNNFSDPSAGGVDDDDIFDELGELTEEEAAEFREKVVPIRLALVKVRAVVFSSHGWHLCLTDSKDFFQSYQFIDATPSRMETNP
jgi:hypothetical protein